MKLLESPWFFRMVEAQAKTPAERLVAVFSVTEAWISAPGIREKISRDYAEHSHALYSNIELKEFLTATAMSAKAQNPASLVIQLVILLQGAIAEEMRNPEMHAIAEASKAARAVVAKACRGDRKRGLRDHMLGGLAASMLVAAIGYYPAMRLRQPDDTHPALAAHQNSFIAPASSRSGGASPDSVYAVLALQEQIQNGTCPAPQLLALPPGQVTAYMNIINFRTPDNPAADRENIRAFLAWFDKTRSSECYSPPANGHTTVAWVSRQTVAR